MGDVRLIFTADALYGSHAFEHNSQLMVAQRCTIRLKFLLLLESPDRNSLLVATMPLSH
jgi:hypothetical protein